MSWGQHSLCRSPLPNAQLLKYQNPYFSHTYFFMNLPTGYTVEAEERLFLYFGQNLLGSRGNKELLIQTAQTLYCKGIPIGGRGLQMEYWLCLGGGRLHYAMKRLSTSRKCSA